MGSNIKKFFSLVFFSKKTKPLIMLVIITGLVMMAAYERYSSEEFLENYNYDYEDYDNYAEVGDEIDDTGSDDVQAYAVQELTEDIVTVVELDKRWAAIGQFSEGMCPVEDKVNGLWGYVGKDGEYIIEPKFYGAMPFSEGLAAVKDSSGFYRFIDKTGTVKITGNIVSVERRFKDELPGFRDGAALIKFDNGVYALVSIQGEIVKIFDYDFVWQENPEYRYYGDMIVKETSFYDTYYNEVGTRINIGLNYEAGNIDWVNRFIKIAEISNGLYTEAIYDFNGNVVVNPKYRRVVPLSREAFWVSDESGASAIIDAQGNELVPFSNNAKFDMMSDNLPNMNALPFTADNGSGAGKAMYFDIASKQVRESFLLPDGANAHRYIFHTKTGEIYRVRKLYIEEIYYISDGDVKSYSLSPSKFSYISNFGLFLLDGIIPTHDADGYGFALIQNGQGVH